ncbi:MAG: hypothetical protein SNJ67_10110 [Chloracidobacterium sp.]
MRRIPKSRTVRIVACRRPAIPDAPFCLPAFVDKPDYDQHHSPAAHP